MSTLVSTVESSTDGLKTWQTVHVGTNSLTTTTERGLASGGVYTVTTTQSDGSKTVAQYRYDWLTSTTHQY